MSTLINLYQYLDNLVTQDVSADELFASSYIRGFICLAAADFGDDQQALSPALFDKVSEQLAEAKTELSPADRQIVKNYWQQLQNQFS